MRIVALAIRNVFRNRHRTLVTTGAMAFAGTIMILFSALMTGMLRDSERNAVSMNLGDIQIHAAGYRDDPDLYTRINDAENLVQDIHSLGLFAAQRLYGFGLAAAGQSSAGVQIRGYDLENEQQVTQLHNHIMTGSWLEAEAPHKIVIGRKLARSLGVSIGDEVIFVGQASDGSMANDLYYVTGILKSVAEDIDRGGFFMTAQAFRELMVLPDGAHEIAVMRPDRKRDLAIAKEKVAALAGPHETLDWKELKPVIARILDLADSQTLVMILITYVAVATIILNAMLMSVFERIQEFGVMKAVGVGPWQITLLIYLETLTQVSIASILALIFGASSSYYFQIHGIDLSAIASSASFGGIALDPVWHAYLVPRALLEPVIFLFIIAALAVIYPALKAALIRPVTAIHHR